MTHKILIFVAILLLFLPIFAPVAVDEEFPAGEENVVSSEPVGVITLDLQALTGNIRSFQPATAAISAGPSIDIVSPPALFVVNSTIPVNVVFIGFNESLIDLDQINNSLTHWYAPVISSPLGPAGGNFTLDVSYFMSNATTLEYDFVSYLATIASVISPPPDLQAYDPSALGAYLFSAVDTVSWLDNNVNSYFGEINSSYCLYIIDTYTWGYITDYYYYDLDMPDPDTGLESAESLTIIYGGEYPNRGVFLDLSAGPVNYHESLTTEADEGVSADTITPIWEYLFPQDKAVLNDNLTEYIQETIDMVFTPSYIYRPVIKDVYDLVVYILDNTSLGDIYTNPTNYIDPSIVTASLEALVPYAGWNTGYYVDYLSSHPGLTQTIKDAYAATDHSTWPNAIHPIQPVLDYLDSHRSEFLMNENTIPVFIFAWDENLYFDYAGALGGAEAGPDGNPLMVLCGFNPNITPNEGYTKLTIHEVGHMLGLRHPHDGWSWDKLYDTGNPSVSDWLRDLISTPMTYAHQDTVFSTFDYDTLDRGHCFDRLNSSWYLLYDANQTLVANGYNRLDTQLEMFLTRALANHSLSLQSFDDLDFESAFYYANLSFLSAEDYHARAIGLPSVIPVLTSPGNETILADATPVLGWNAVSGALEYRVVVAGNPQFDLPVINITTLSTGIETATLPDGIYYWMVQAKDAAGNWGAWSTWWTFKLDTAPPVITLTDPGNSTFGSQQLWLNFTVDETVTWIGYSLDGGASVTISGNTLLTGLSEGVHSVLIQATDVAGNTGSSTTAWFTVDTTAPVIAMTSPINTTYDQQTLWLNFTVDETVTWTGYSLDGGTNVTITGNTLLSGLAEGVHKITVYATDAAGNTGSTVTTWFTVKKTTTTTTTTITTTTTGSSTTTTTGITNTPALTVATLIATMTILSVYHRKRKRI
ncbi:MAG: hypothetical protein ACFFD4_02350 [Candidatus Odinarchaeota archaeon]